MKAIRLTYWLILLTCVASPVCASPDRHKPEAEIVKMTPEQRVQEYCVEYYQHSFEHGDYTDMLRKYILQDGAKALVTITQIINEFDPTNSKGKSREKDARCQAAEHLLQQIDGNVIRVRGIAEGRTAIDALSRSVQRMLAAHFDTADVNKHESSDRYRYEASRDQGDEMRGLNFYDRAIQDTFRIQKKIRLSDKELLEFINYLISQEPRYPSWSTLENYKDMTDLNEAGNPRQFLILKNTEPIYKLYLKYNGAS